MQAQVYPTAPAGFQRHDNVNVPPASATGASAEGNQAHVESPGKTKAVLSKVKHKAKKLKDKIKKVTSSNTTNKHDNEDLDEHKRERESEYPQQAADHESDEVDDGEEEVEDEDGDHILRGDDLAKYQQLRSIGALDEPAGDGSEHEVHGGVPASTPATAAGAGTNLKSNDENAPISPYKTAGPLDALQAAPTQYRNYAGDSDPLLEGTKRKSGDEDAPVSSYKTGGPPDALQAAPAPTQYRNYAGDGDPLLEGHRDMERSAQNDMQHTYSKYAPTERPSLADKTSSGGLAPTESPSLADKTSSSGLPTTTSEAMTSNVPFDNPPPADQLPNEGLHSGDSPSATSDVNVPYPADLVKPNPEFGSSYSPTHHKIGLVNEDLPVDRKLEAGLVPEDQSGSNKHSISETPVPEDAELNNYGSTPPSASQADKQIYTPVSDSDGGPSPTLPPGGQDLENHGHDYERGTPYDDSINASVFANANMDAPSGYDARERKDTKDEVDMNLLSDYDARDESKSSGATKVLPGDEATDQSPHESESVGAMNVLPVNEGDDVRDECKSVGAMNVLPGDEATDQSPHEFGSVGAMNVLPVTEGDAARDESKSIGAMNVLPGDEATDQSPHESESFGAMNVLPFNERRDQSPHEYDNVGAVHSGDTKDEVDMNLLPGDDARDESKSVGAMNVLPGDEATDHAPHESESVGAMNVLPVNEGRDQSPHEYDSVGAVDNGDTKDEVDMNLLPGDDARDESKRVGAMNVLPGDEATDHSTRESESVGAMNVLPGDEATDHSPHESESVGAMNVLPVNEGRDQSPHEYDSVGAVDSRDVRSVNPDKESWGQWSDKIGNTKDVLSTTLIGSGKRNVDDPPAAVHNNTDTQTGNAAADGLGKSSTDRMNNEADSVTSILGAGGNTAEGMDPEQANSQRDYGRECDDIMPDSQIVEHVNRGADAQETTPEDVLEQRSADNLSTAVGNKVESPHDHKNMPTRPGPGGIGDVSEDKVDEYYDPNEIKDSQFQEGFSRGAEDAEKEAFNGTLTGSAIGTLQGMRDTVASKLGYGGTAPMDVEEVKPQAESEEVEQSPSQPTTFAQGLRNTMASTLGYGKPASAESTLDNIDEYAGKDAAPKETEGANLSPKQQKTGGTLLGLRNVLASKLGYGSAPEDKRSEQMVHDGSGETAMQESIGRNVNGNEVPEVSSTVVEDRADVADEPSSYTQKLRDTTSAARDSSRVGYGGNSNEKETIGTGYGDDEKAGEKVALGGEDQPTFMAPDGEKPTFTAPDAYSDHPTSYTQKLNDTTAAAKDDVLAKVDYGSNGNDDKRAAGTGGDEEQGENAGRRDGEKPNVTAPDAYDDQPSSYTQNLFKGGEKPGENLGSAYAPNANSEGDSPIHTSATTDLSGEGENPIYTSANAEAEKETDTKPSIASRIVAPAEEDKALSKVFTEKMSSTATMLGQKLRIPGVGQNSSARSSQPSNSGDA